MKAEAEAKEKALRFNRTFMELKQEARKEEEERQGFNRTFMELKYEILFGLLNGNTVLIVPLWN